MQVFLDYPIWTNDSPTTWNAVLFEGEARYSYKWSTLLVLWYCNGNPFQRVCACLIRPKVIHGVKDDRLQRASSSLSCLSCCVRESPVLEITGLVDRSKSTIGLWWHRLAILLPRRLTDPVWPIQTDGASARTNRTTACTTSYEQVDNEHGPADSPLEQNDPTRTRKKRTNEPRRWPGTWCL